MVCSIGSSKAFNDVSDCAAGVAHADQGEGWPGAALFKVSVYVVHALLSCYRSSDALLM